MLVGLSLPPPCIFLLLRQVVRGVSAYSIDYYVACERAHQAVFVLLPVPQYCRNLWQEPLVPKLGRVLNIGRKPLEHEYYRQFVSQGISDFVLENAFAISVGRGANDKHEVFAYIEPRSQLTDDGFW